MTRDQVRTALIPLVRALLKGGSPVVGFDGLDGDLGQLTVRTPLGQMIEVELPVATLGPATLVDFVAQAQTSVRKALRPFEGDCGRGFGGRRGTLGVQQQYSSLVGWV